MEKKIQSRDLSLIFFVTNEQELENINIVIKKQTKNSHNCYTVQRNKKMKHNCV